MTAIGGSGSKGKRRPPEASEATPKLRLSGEHLAVTQRIADSGSAEVDLSTTNAVWSEALYRITGQPPAEIAPTFDEFLSFVHEDDRETVREKVIRDVEGERPEAFDFRMFRPDGTMRWLRRHSELRRDPSGHTVRLVEVYQDITERKKLEADLKARDEALEQSREHLVLAQRIARVGSIERDLRTNRVTVSDEVYRLLDLEPGAEPPTVESMYKHVHPDDMELMNELHRQSWLGKELPPTEYRLIRPNGEIRWIRRESAITRDAEGRPVVSASTMMDITERRQMEMELLAHAEEQRRKEEHLRRAQSVGSVGSSEVDLVTGEHHWSEEYFRLLGYEPGSVRPGADLFFERVHPDDRGKLHDFAALLKITGSIPPVEIRVIRPDGSLRWLRRLADVTRENGKPVRILFFLQDITDRKKLESELTERAEELRRSEAHLRHAQSVGMFGSSQVDLATGETQWTNEYFRLLGYEPGSVKPQRELFMQAVVPEDRDKLADYSSLLALKGPIPPARLRVRWPNGSIRWMERNVEILRDRDRPVQMVFSLQDITERRQMEQALIDAAEEARRHREHLARAQSVGMTGSSEVDLATGKQTWSDEFFRLLGYEPGEVVPGRDTFVASVIPEDHSMLVTLDELAGSHGPIPSRDLRIRTRSGQVRWLRQRIEVIRKDGKPAQLLFILQDVTDRRQMEQALIDAADEARRHREHLSRAQRTGRIGSAEVDLRTGAVFWSDEWRELLGLGRDVVPGFDTFRAVVHPDDRERIRPYGDLIAQGKAVEPTSFRVILPKGEIRWFYRVTDYAYDKEGAPIALCITLTDITELREAQEESARLQDQLAHAQKLDSLGALSGGIAHDFNNLLTTILGSAALLRDDKSLDFEGRKLAQAVVRAAEQGADLTRRLLSFGRRQMLKPEALDLPAVARELNILLRHTLGEHIELKVHADHDLWPATADRNQLETAIINIAVNARDAMPGGGTLSLSISNKTFDDAFVAGHAGAARGDYVAVSVSDTGTGMSPDVLARAFEPFFTTKPEGRGTGLGLAMVYGFVKQSGGYATIDSELSVGTRVTLYLPRGETAKATPAAMPQRERGKGGSERILLVEDDEWVREFVETALGRLGYRVISKPNAAEALAELKRAGDEVDLLVTDLMLPGGMNGNELAAEARRDRPLLRVLFASGYTEDTLILQGRLEPGQLLLPKPFEGAELAAKVREALGN